MLPSQLTAENFAAYPPEAKRLAVAQLPVLRRLPLAFVPLLLREVIVFDWKFPAERRDLEHQFQYLAALSPEDFNRAIAAFARLQLSPQLERTNWVDTPADFSEQLTAHLWATHEIDSFRAAAVNYVQKSTSPPGPLPTHRLAIVVLGQGTAQTDYPLFRKLSREGTHFTQVRHENGLRTLLDAVARRATEHPEPYGHWCIDGGSGAASPGTPIVHVSYSALAPARAALQSRMQKSYEGAVFNPETFRTMMARLRPEEVGLDSSRDPVLTRFQLSLLTEGSGTQVFATTFVQWAARETLRRAQPLTLLARFAPRQREKPMNELLAESLRPPELDPQGSLIDADMGAYYTWLNQQRLPAAEKAAFLVWFEDHEEAVIVGPAIARGKRINAPTLLSNLIAQVV